MSEQPMWTPKVGDVVRLKSGGPRMTVEVAKSLPEVRCVWFEGGELHRDLFRDVQLEQAPI